MFMRGPKRFSIAFAHAPANVLAADKGRIPDDIIRRWPFRPLGVRVAPHFNAIAFRVRALQRAPVFAPRQFPRAPGQNRVGDLDCLKILQDRFGRNAAARAKMPLQKANPQDQFGNRRRARIHLQPQELMRVDGFQFIAGEARLFG